MNHEQKFEYLLRIADTLLIYGQRLSEWCGHGPVLEEDIALSNIALDYLGQSSNLLKHAADMEGKGRDEDQLAFLRDVKEYNNLLIVELPNGDYAKTISRQFLFSSWYYLLLQRLQNSGDDFLKGFAEKSIKEVRYHVQHASDWIKRLGDGTDESHTRIQNAINDLWSYTGEFFAWDEMDRLKMKGEWKSAVEEIMNEATLITPSDAIMITVVKSGNHTEHLEPLLSEMQFMQRTFPGAKW